MHVHSIIPLHLAMHAENEKQLYMQNENKRTTIEHRFYNFNLLSWTIYSILHLVCVFTIAQAFSEEYLFRAFTTV